MQIICACHLLFLFSLLPEGSTHFKDLYTHTLSIHIPEFLYIMSKNIQPANGYNRTSTLKNCELHCANCCYFASPTFDRQIRKKMYWEKLLLFFYVFFTSTDYSLVIPALSLYSYDTYILGRCLSNINYQSCTFSTIANNRWSSYHKRGEPTCEIRLQFVGRGRRLLEGSQEPITETTEGSNAFAHQACFPRPLLKICLSP